jgi:DNA-binding HxlR family transcriptional regulator
MLKKDYTDQDCSIARALEFVGERWTLLIVRELLRKPCRFVDLEQALAVAKNILTARLDAMCAVGIVKKTPLERRADWFEYRLTKKGRDLFPVVNALMAWGDRYAAPDGPPVILEHRCGHSPGHHLVCKHCGDPIDGHSVRVTYQRKRQNAR